MASSVPFESRHLLPECWIIDFSANRLQEVLAARLVLGNFCPRRRPGQCGGLRSLRGRDWVSFGNLFFRFGPNSGCCSAARSLELDTGFDRTKLVGDVGCRVRSSRMPPANRGSDICRFERALLPDPWRAVQLDDRARSSDDSTICRPSSRMVRKQRLTGSERNQSHADQLREGSSPASPASIRRQGSVTRCLARLPRLQRLLQPKGARNLAPVEHPARRRSRQTAAPPGGVRRESRPEAESQVVGLAGIVKMPQASFHELIWLKPWSLEAMSLGSDELLRRRLRKRFVEVLDHPAGGPDRPAVIGAATNQCDKLFRCIRVGSASTWPATASVAGLKAHHRQTPLVPPHHDTRVSIAEILVDEQTDPLRGERDECNSGMVVIP